MFLFITVTVPVNDLMTETLATPTDCVANAGGAYTDTGSLY